MSKIHSYHFVVGGTVNRPEFNPEVDQPIGLHVEILARDDEQAMERIRRAYPRDKYHLKGIDIPELQRSYSPPMPKRPADIGPTYAEVRRGRDSGEKFSHGTYSDAINAAIGEH